MSFLRGFQAVAKHFGMPEGRAVGEYLVWYRTRNPMIPFSHTPQLVLSWFCLAVEVGVVSDSNGKLGAM